MNEKHYPTEINIPCRQPGNCGDKAATGPTMKDISGAESNGYHRRLLFGLGERGQSMVEMAFVLPLFLALVFAIIEMGRAWGAKQSPTIAAREGARILVLPYGAGLTYTSESEVQNAALNTVRASMNSSGVPVTPQTQITLVRITPGNNGIYDDTYPNDDQIEQNYTGGKRGERVGIQISYPFETPLPIILGMFNNGRRDDLPNQTGVVMSLTCYMDHE